MRPFLCDCPEGINLLQDTLWHLLDEQIVGYCLRVVPFFSFLDDVGITHCFFPCQSRGLSCSPYGCDAVWIVWRHIRWCDEGRLDLRAVEMAPAPLRLNANLEAFEEYTPVLAGLIKHRDGGGEGVGVAAESPTGRVGVGFSRHFFLSFLW